MSDDELPRRLVCMVSEADWQAITDTFYNHRYANKSEAIRALLRAGLLAHERDPADAGTPEPDAEPAPFVQPELNYNKAGDPQHKQFHRKVTAMMEKDQTASFSEAQLLERVFGRAPGQIEVGDLPCIANNMKMLGFTPQTVRGKVGAKSTKIYSFG